MVMALLMKTMMKTMTMHPAETPRTARQKQRLDAGAMLRGADTKRGQILLRKQEKVSAYLADHVLWDESLSQITSFDGPHVFWA